MSETTLHLIPTDPTWQPRPDDAAQAAALVAALDPDALGISVDYRDRIVLFDAGTNWAGIACPSCGAPLSDDWFGRRLEAAGAGFTHLAVTTPCCSARTTLNDLAFGWPVGFARFAISVRTPSRPWRTPDAPWFTGEEVDAVARAVGAPLRQVLAHS